MALMALISLYNYDETLLDGLLDNIPRADRVPVSEYPDLYRTPVDIDKDTLAQNLVIDCAEFEVIYSNPGFLKLAISAWAKSQAQVWQDMYNTIWYKYNPIWNKDGTMSHITTETRDLQTTGHEQLNAESENNQNLQNTENLTNEHAVAGFNVSDYSNKEKEQVTRTSQTTDNNTSTGKQEKSNTGGETGTITTETRESERGNIGVTTTQTMIEEQRDSVLFNIYNLIISDFKNRFCITIY